MGRKVCVGFGICKNITFFGDIKIFLDTVKVVLKRDGINSATAATMEEFVGTDKK